MIRSFDQEINFLPCQIISDIEPNENNVLFLYFSVIFILDDPGHFQRDFGHHVHNYVLQLCIGA